MQTGPERRAHPLPAAVIDLVQRTLTQHVSPAARLLTLEEVPRTAPERGRDPIRRYAALVEGGDTSPWRVTLFTKEAGLVERRVLALLGGRGLGVPFSSTTDLQTDGPALVCLEDVGEHPPVLTYALTRQLGERLATVHRTWLSRGDEFAWLTRADRAGLTTNMLDYWRYWWERCMADPAFAATFGERFGEIEAAEARFLDWLDDQFRAGDTLTLIHGDMHPAQVTIADGILSIIDWEHAAYGPLYLDLPNVFTSDAAESYRAELVRLGHAIPAPVFEKNLREAGRYVGFKYMGFVLSGWEEGERDAARGRVNSILTAALTGRHALHPEIRQSKS